MLQDHLKNINKTKDIITSFVWSNGKITNFSGFKICLLDF